MISPSRAGFAIVASLVILSAAHGTASGQTAPPGAPQNVAAVAAGFTVTISWSPPLTGAPIDDYQLDFGQQPGVYLATAPVGPVLTFSLDLPPGTYYFRVTAENAIGLGTPSPEVSVTVGIGTVLPSPPLNVLATAIADTLIVTWSPPATGVPITGYFLWFGTSPGVTQGRIAVGAATSFSTSVAGAAPGRYYFKVSAVNAQGEGPPSAEVSVFLGRIPSPPSAPRQFDGAVVNDVLTLTWQPPATGAPITGYMLAMRTGSSLFSSTGSFPLGLVTSFSAPIAGLASGDYIFTVYAVNADGIGLSSAEVLIPWRGAQVPGAPENLRAIVSGGVLTIDWTAPSTGGTPTTYVLQAGSIHGAANLGTIPLGLLTSFSVPVGGISGTFYFSVTATNDGGSGPASEEVEVTLGQPPTLINTAPRNFAASVNGGMLVLTWSPPASGTAPTRYLLRYSLGGGPWSAPYDVGTVLALSVPSSTMRGNWRFRVSPVNTWGEGAWSRESLVTVDPTAPMPSAPRDLVVVVGGGQLGVAWSPPLRGVATGYTLYVSSRPGAHDIGAVQVTSPGLAAPVGFLAGRTIFLRVHALYAGGPGLLSEEVSVAVP